MNHIVAWVNSCIDAAVSNRSKTSSSVIKTRKRRLDYGRRKGVFNVKYKEGSLDPKTAQLIFFAVCIATGYEFGAKHHLSKARECGATEDEITEAVVYSMRPAAAKVRNLAQSIIAK